MKKFRFIPFCLIIVSIFGLVRCPQFDFDNPVTDSDDGVCEFSFDPDISERTVVNLIESADSTIDIALYGFENTFISEALIDAAKRGVTIRACTEYDSESEEGWQSLLAAARDLDYVDITVKLGNVSGIMHNKYFIVDSTYVITGSTNLTDSMLYHFNNLILLRSASLADDFQRDFDVLFAGYNASEKGNSLNLNQVTDGDGELIDENGYNTIFGAGERWPETVHAIGAYQVQAFFTPYKAIFPSYHKDDPVQYEYYNYESESVETAKYDNGMNIIFPLIDSAATSIYIFSFAFTDKVVMDRLAKAQERGVTVKVWMDYTMFASGFSHSGKSIIELAKRITSFKVCRKPDGGLLHHKVILIDGSTVVLGSLNFSSNAVSNNDENFLVIKNAATIHDAFMTEAKKINDVSHVIRVDEYNLQDEEGSHVEGE